MEKAVHKPTIARVGIWGSKAGGGPQNRWQYLLEKGHTLKKITIDHGDKIYSLMFTSESNGVLYTSEKVGGWSGGDTISEVIFEDNERIIGIDGTIGRVTVQSSSYSIVSSIFFLTTNKTHGPYGQVTDTPFSIPIENAHLVGFYGLASNYIDGIGVYVNIFYDEIAKVGIWGTRYPEYPNEKWSFQLERNHQLHKIIIDHGDHIYSLMFTAEFKGIQQTSMKFGGWNGGSIESSEVIFAGDEQIIGISGTVDCVVRAYNSFMMISSLKFITNKKTHGPYGREKGIPFNVPWGSGLFSGFYGSAGNYIYGIGVYLKAATI